MSRTLQWLIGIGVVVIVAAVVFASVWPLFMPRSGWAGAGIMGPGHMLGGGGMMGGFGMPVFGLGMLLWPLLVIGLVVVGAAWLVRSLGTQGVRPAPPTTSGPACAHCGKQLEAGWKACPACGERV